MLPQRTIVWLPSPMDVCNIRHNVLLERCQSEKSGSVKIHYHRIKLWFLNFYSLCGTSFSQSFKLCPYSLQFILIQWVHFLNAISSNYYIKIYRYRLNKKRLFSEQNMRHSVEARFSNLKRFCQQRTASNTKAFASHVVL